MKIPATERVLVIGDPHLGPGTSHRDYLPFLCAVRNKYRLDTHLCVGDVADWHSISYHEREFWAVGADEELAAIRKCVGPWAKEFPRLYITRGNHDALPERRLKTHGLPRAMGGADYNQLLSAPAGWVWDSTHHWRMKCGVKVVMSHAFSGSWTALAKAADTCCLIQGHHHEMGGVVWSNNPNGETWALSAGCGINPNASAFNYRSTGKRQLNRPILGCGIIIDGTAQFLPMWLGRHGRWTGKVP
jgi:hypothetical protein